jgi:hypothetical protein
MTRAPADLITSSKGPTNADVQGPRPPTPEPTREVLLGIITK